VYTEKTADLPHVNDKLTKSYEQESNLRWMYMYTVLSKVDCRRGISAAYHNMKHRLLPCLKKWVKIKLQSLHKWKRKLNVYNYQKLLSMTDFDWWVLYIFSQWNRPVSKSSFINSSLVPVQYLTKPALPNAYWIFTEGTNRCDETI